MILFDHGPLASIVRRRLTRDDDMLPVFRGLFAGIGIVLTAGRVGVLPVQRDAGFCGVV